MRAAVLKAPRDLVITDARAPEPGPSEVQVRLAGGGICASELPVYEGRDWFDYPRAAGEPGHEGWGRVEAVGDEVAGVEVGQRVALISFRAHAELDVTDAANVVALPDELDDRLPFPGEPLACALNAFNRSGVELSDRVAIVGCGFFGLLLVQLCAGWANEIVAISSRESARALALATGANAVHAPGAQALGDGTFDVVFEATGHQEPLDLASRLTRVRGRLVIVGYHQDGRRSVDMQLWNWRGLDVINAHERDRAVYVRGLQHAVEAVRVGRLKLGPLVTHRYPLDELDNAYRVSLQRPEGFVKAVWCYG